MGLWGYAGRRVLAGVLVVAGVSVAVFFMLHLLGDPTALFVPPDATAQQIAQLRHLLGLDRSLPVQLVSFVIGVLHGDFGQSFVFGQPAMGLVLTQMPATLELTGAALALSLVLAVPLGIAAAARHNTAWDRIISTACFLGLAMPVFWVGVMLIIVFAVRLHWLPTSGSGGLQHLILPAVTLALWPLSQYVRLLRSEILEVFRQDYIRTAYAKGLRRITVLYKHALRNALIPLITVIGLTTGSMLGGAILTETVFAWPGVGRLVVNSIEMRDYPVVQAAVFMVALIFVAVNTVVDLTYGIVDPRIRYN